MSLLFASPSGPENDNTAHPVWMDCEPGMALPSASRYCSVIVVPANALPLFRRYSSAASVSASNSRVTVTSPYSSWV